MASTGRGRGWGSVQDKDKGIPLRRPGDIILSANIEVDSLIAAVQGISLHEPNESAAMLRGIEELLKSQCQTEESLRSVVQRLHDRSLEDRQFGMKAAAAYSTVASLEVSGVKLRTVLLQAVQKDYEDRAHLQTACHPKFLNAIALLGEVFHRVRLPDGSPINILATAVMQYQDMLLSGDEHEMELFTTQLAINGRKLYDSKAASLEELLLRVRTTLMSRNLSGQSRCWLLLAMDLAANRYAPLSGQLQNFYQIHLGATALLQLQRLQLGLTVDTNSNKSVSNNVSETETTDSSTDKSISADGDGILTNCKQPEQLGQNSVENGNVVPFRPTGRVNRTSNSFKSNSSGSGFKPRDDGNRSGGDTGKYGKKFNNSSSASDNTNWRKKGDDDIWGNKRGEKSQSWGHDDRFEKDDDFYGKQTQRTEGVTRSRNRDRKSSEGKGKEKVSEDKEQWRSSELKKEQKNEVKREIVSPPIAAGTAVGEENWD